MGYYATSIDGNITIPKRELNETLNTVIEAYRAHNDQAQRWFTLDIPTDLESVLTNAGFDFMLDNDEMVIYTFDSKWHDYIENCLIPALLAHATEDSAMAFRGEDGEMWRLAKGVRGIQTATVIWS